MKYLLKFLVAVFQAIFFVRTQSTTMLWPQSANFDMIHFFIYLNSSLPTLFTKTTKDNLMFHDK